MRSNRSALRRSRAEDALLAVAYERDLRRAPSRPVLDIGAIRAATMAGAGRYAVRDPRAWTCGLRSRDPGRIALDLARHAFALYPVPRHLERVWLGDETLTADEVALRKAWYFCVAQGRSLHKEHTGGFLTKRETHRFLNPPGRPGFREALWYAVARSTCDDHGTCLRVARSKAARPVVTPFWKDAVRFFCASGLASNRIDDLVDYLVHRRAGDPGFSLRGRTVASLTAAMEEWHRDAARRARVEGGSWTGHDIGGYEHVEDDEAPAHLRATWTIVQILTGNELAEEGSRQRHCVASYKRECMGGGTSIWSLRRIGPKGMERVLTLEVRRERRIVQVRGFANRLATQDEMRHVRRWAAAEGLFLP